MFMFVPAAQAATITVTTTADSVANDGKCSLREAITAAATKTKSGSAAGECPAGSGNDTIALGAQHYVLSRTGPPDDTNATGDLDITKGTLTITGAGASSTTINAGGIDRAIDVLAGATLTLQKLTITGGHAPDGSNGANANDGAAGGDGQNGGDSKGGTGGDGAGGGGVRNAGTLTIENVAVTGNDAGAGGSGGAAGFGGAGGSSNTSAGGAGGASVGGNGGNGGGGGGLLSTAGAVTILSSSFAGNASGAGGAGGGAGQGGSGGNSNGGTVSGGAGGDSNGGEGGEGGNGGAIEVTNGALTLTDSVVQQNDTGAGGGSGAPDVAGEGGNGVGSGAGGEGGDAIGGDGGSGGNGGGVADDGGPVTIVNTTISVNVTGAGGPAAPGGVGGHGGLGGTSGRGGAGNADIAGIGGSGGWGGGVYARSGSSTIALPKLIRDTLSGNTTGAGKPGADADHGGTGGAGGGGQGAGGLSGGGIGGEGGFGGGAAFQTGFTIEDTTITGNRAGAGGAAGAGGSGPGESFGGIGGEGGDGGIAGEGEGAVNHVTSVGNTVGAGGATGSPGTGSPASPGLPGEAGSGADLDAFGGFSPEVSVSASIIGGCAGEPADGGGNITPPTTTPSCPGKVANPKLGSLANNGGPTETMALLAGSPAIDLIKAPCGTAPDQRGVARPQGAGCDAGAYEFAPPDVTAGRVVTLAGTSATVAGSIVPNARATTWFVQYGANTHYGKQTAVATLAAGVAVDPVKVLLKGLRRRSTVHYRFVATNADGTAFGADATLKTPSFAGVRIVSRKLTAGSTGRVPLTLACPAGAIGACKGSLSISAVIKHKRTTLGRVAFSIAHGHRKRLTVRLGQRARAAVGAAGRRGLAVTVTATAKDSSGGRAQTTATGRLK